MRRTVRRSCFLATDPSHLCDKGNTLLPLSRGSFDKWVTSSLTVDLLLGSDYGNTNQDSTLILSPLQMIKLDQTEIHLSAAPLDSNGFNLEAIWELASDTYKIQVKKQLSCDVSIPTCKPCLAGLYSFPVSTTPILDQVSCLPCEPGRASGIGSSDCPRCNDGEEAINATSSCTKCRPGMYSNNQSAACEVCLEGSYTPEPASSSCRDVPSTYQQVCPRTPKTPH